MFAGQSTRPINQKNQVTLPAEMRSLLNDQELEVGFGASISPADGCIYLLKYTDFQERVSALSEKMTPAQRREVLRKVATVKPDKQGRVVIPEWMRKEVGIADTVEIIGNGPRIEIWAAEVLSSYDEKTKDSADADSTRQEIFDF